MNKDAVLSEYISRLDLARQLKKSPRTLDAWWRRRIGPRRTKIGKSVYYSLEAVRKFIENGEEG